MLSSASKRDAHMSGKKNGEQVQLGTRIDGRIKKAVELYCNSRGLKMNRFIEDALVDKLEELQDSEDVKKLRTEPTRPLEGILEEMGLDDLL